MIIPTSAANEKTIGEIALELQKKGDQKQGVIDTQRAMMEKYVENLIECAKTNEKQFGKDKPFYLCVQTRRERLIENVIRNQFYARRTRPAPTYDLALYWYDPKDERIEFVWCIPDKDSVQQIIQDKKDGILPQDQMQLAEFCEWFLKGTLI